MVRRGFSRSFALWEESRRPTNTKQQTLRAYINAICYELQPFRFASIKWSQSYYKWKNFFQKLVTETLPWLCGVATRVIRNLTLKQWLWIGGILLYYAAVRIIHELLDAGPIVMILTALVVIFTIGLGDDSDNENRVSAYSVFNRGFQQLMGSVDADHLLQQHVGGAGAAAALMGVNNDNNNNQAVGLQPADRRPNDNNVDTNNEEMQDVPNDGTNNNDNNNNNNPANSRARKSGKKTRRRNFEQRQELRQQRRAAQEFAGDDIALQQALMEAE